MGIAVRSSRVNIPQLVNLKQAITMYYTKTALTNSDIKALFACGPDKVADLKMLAKEVTAEKDKMQWNSLTVRTDDAFEAWGLDIDDLEKRYTKLKKLGVET